MITAMYKILMAEDEAVIREGIRDTIRWSDYGFEDIVICQNGQDAIARIEEGFKPDVLITDICMPFVDGLELSKYVSEKKPDTIIVILSGYDDFKYAQQAVKLRARDYILKPVTSVQMRELIAKFRQELDSAQRKLSKIPQLECDVTDVYSLLRAEFLNDLISSNAGRQHIDRKMRQFQIHLSGNYFCAAVVDIDDLEEVRRQYQNAEAHTLRYAVFNISEEIIKTRHGSVCFQYATKQTVLLFSGKDRDSLALICYNTIAEISFLIRENLGFTVSAGVGRLVSSPHELFSSYSDAEYALDYRFFRGSCSIILRQEISDPHENKPDNTGCEKKLTNALKAGSREQAEKAVDSFIESLRSSGMHPGQCIFELQRFLSKITNTVEGLDLENSAQIVHDALEKMNLFSCTTLDQAGNALKSFCGRLTEYICCNQNSHLVALVLQAKQYIKEHYTDPELSLLSVTKASFVSVSHFCAAFKSQTGKTFLEYVNRLRMEKAQEQLVFTDKSISEVALSVGYTDHRYFSVVFKNYCGMTPKEYRLNQRKAVI